MISTYYVGSTPFKTRADAVRRAQEYADSDGMPVTVTVERQKTDAYTKTRGRALGFSVSSLLPSKSFVVKPHKRGRSNPGGRKLTKTQRRAKAKSAASKRRKVTAAVKMLKAMNPASKLAGVKIRKNRGGSVTIIPIKKVKR